MASKKEKLKTIKENYIGAEIIVSYKKAILQPSLTINKYEDVYQMIKNVWNENSINLQEQFMAFYLNRNMNLIGYKLINTGYMVQCAVDVKLLVSISLHSMATAVIIAHNHPSGSVKPSINDETVTQRIKNALQLIDVRLLDHFIITEDDFLSFQREGLL